MRPYSVYIHERILAEIPRSVRVRVAIMSFVRNLGDDPFQTGDYQDQDDSGRALEVKLVAGFAITYFADHAVCEVKVVKMQPADAV